MRYVRMCGLDVEWRPKLGDREKAKDGRRISKREDRPSESKAVESDQLEEPACSSNSSSNSSASNSENKDSKDDCTSVRLHVVDDSVNSSSSSELSEQVTAQADKVRALKAAGADKAEIAKEVSVLLALKKAAGIEGSTPNRKNKLVEKTRTTLPNQTKKALKNQKSDDHEDVSGSIKSPLGGRRNSNRNNNTKTKSNTVVYRESGSDNQVSESDVEGAEMLGAVSKMCLACDHDTTTSNSITEKIQQQLNHLQALPSSPNLSSSADDLQTSRLSIPPIALHARHHSPCSTLQCATQQFVLIFDLFALCTGVLATQFNDMLSALFQGPTLKVGFGLPHDVARLAKSYPSLTSFRCLVPCVDLQKEQGGLSSLCVAKLGKPLDKRMQTSDWGCRPLSSAQLRYAALDARCLVELVAPPFRTCLFQVTEVTLDKFVCAVQPMSTTYLY